MPWNVLSNVCKEQRRDPSFIVDQKRNLKEFEVGQKIF